MVFCYQNCSDVLREKNVLVIKKNDAKGRKFANFFRSLEQFIGTIFEEKKFNLLLEVCFYKWIKTIQLPSGTNNLDVEICRKKLENICIYVFFLRLKNASHGM